MVRLHTHTHTITGEHNKILCVKTAVLDFILTLLPRKQGSTVNKPLLTLLVQEYSPCIKVQLYFAVGRYYQ